MPCSLPRPADEAAWGGSCWNLTASTHRTREACMDRVTQKHTHTLAHGHICTHTPALVHKCSYPRVALRATHAQKQHKHPDTPTLVHLHSQALETHILPLQRNPQPSHIQLLYVDTQTHTTHRNSGNHPYAVMPSYIQSHLYSPEDNYRFRTSPHPTQHAEVSTHAQTYSGPVR